MRMYFASKVTKAEIFDGRLASYGVEVRQDEKMPNAFALVLKDVYLLGEEKDDGFVEFMLLRPFDVRPIFEALFDVFGDITAGPAEIA